MDVRVVVELILPDMFSREDERNNEWVLEDAVFEALEENGFDWYLEDDENASFEIQEVERLD
jgi:hypothetical protein